MAAAHGSLVVPAVDSDANYRTYVSAIHDALAACGFTQTADTGQVNPATVTLPAGNNDFTNYEIWRFNDSKQAATPFFFKVKYSTFNSRIQPRFSLGTGSDGAGTLTNETAISNTYSGSAAAKTIYWSGDAAEGRFAWVQNTLYGTVIILERLRDNDGAINDDGIYVYVGNANYGGGDGGGCFCPGKSWRFWFFYVYAQGMPGVQAPTANDGSCGNGTDWGFFPVLPVHVKLANPLLGVWTFSRLAGAVSGSEESVEVYGVARNFIYLGDADASYPNGNTTSMRLALLWE